MNASEILRFIRANHGAVNTDKLLVSRDCCYSHELDSDHNQQMLREHGLESLRRAELSTLMLLQALDKMPYRWEVREDDQWAAMPENEMIEKDYCNPNNSHSTTSPPVCFDTMTCGPNDLKVRRLLTTNSLLEPSFNEWVWYWEDGFGKWNIYGSTDGGHKPADLDSAALEQKFLDNDKDVVEFSANSQSYSLNFQDMIQTNKRYGTKKVVRKRPRFVSVANVQARRASRGCCFSHELDSDPNQQMLREHGLESLRRAELSKLMLLQAHDKMPYRWEVREDDQWAAMPENEMIEKDYCDPNNSHSTTSPPVCFDTMTCGPNDLKVRRLLTNNSLLEPSFNEWVWYWEDGFGKWNIYASTDGGHKPADLDSAALEQKFLDNDKDVVEFSTNSQSYSLNFQDMIQTNKRYGTKKVVRRRPRFVSVANVQARRARKPLGQMNFAAVPAHWDKTQVPQTGFKRNSLLRSMEEFKKMESLFCATRKGFDLVSIERIQNKALWEVFQRRDCRFSHELDSDHNQQMLREHGLESLSGTELSILMLLQAHVKMPYRWEVREDDQWAAMPENETIEKDYCNPKNSNSTTSPPVCFDTMTCGPNDLKVRRLLTNNSLLEPSFIQTTEWVWYWEDEFGKWNIYGSTDGGHKPADLDSAALEQKFLDNDKDVVEFSTNSQSYSLNFQDMIQTNKRYGTKKVVRRRPRFVSAADVQAWRARKPLGQMNFAAVPAHWDQTQVPQTGFKRISLLRSSEEFKEMESLFCATMKGFDLVSIERIQNKALWEVFQWQKIQMKNKIGGRYVTEKNLFHGTDNKFVDTICQNNMDWRLCGTHGTSYGKGSYFARDAKYSHRYTSDSSVKSMFIARLLVGDYTKGSRKYPKAPSKDGGDVNFFDSCVDDVANPSIYVLFEKHQIYPEYLLQYRTSQPLDLLAGAASVTTQNPVPVPKPASSCIIA